MTDSTYTHIAILADRSGSMGEQPEPGSMVTKADLATKGIHELIADQARQAGKATFSLEQFDGSGTDRVLWFQEGHELPAGWRIMPRGNTPLLDATGVLITQIGEHLAAMPEDGRPARVIFVIGTDGKENVSSEYTKPQIADMITHQRERYGWDFVFIGADFDAFGEASSIGIPLASSLQSSGVALAAAYNSTSSAISRSRAGGQSVFYTDDEREQAGGH